MHENLNYGLRVCRIFSCVIIIITIFIVVSFIGGIGGFVCGRAQILAKNESYSVRNLAIEL